MLKHQLYTTLAASLCLIGCSEAKKESRTDKTIVKEVIVTETTKHDTDDPAIYIDSSDVSQSFIIGTDKDIDGGLYAFDLEGNIIKEKCVFDLKRPNNVDVAYGLRVNDSTRIDIAVTTERFTHKLRVFKLPEMKAIDNGGLPVFEGETAEEFRDLMGIALYTDPSTKSISAIVGRKNGPTDGTYLWQYGLSFDSTGTLKASLKRKFGQFSGNKEIEAIAVDNELGYVYYSDEGIGIRKYYAHPDNSNVELALFGKKGFADDHEGISIYKTTDSTGYILVSDQQANAFRVFPREGTLEGPHNHPLFKVIYTNTESSDGSDVTSLPLGDNFKGGLFVAMSEGKVFKYFSWADLAGDDLNKKQ